MKRLALLLPLLALAAAPARAEDPATNAPARGDLRVEPNVVSRILERYRKMEKDVCSRLRVAEDGSVFLCESSAYLAGYIHSKAAVPILIESIDVPSDGTFKQFYADLRGYKVVDSNGTVLARAVATTSRYLEPPSPALAALTQIPCPFETLLDSIEGEHDRTNRVALLAWLAAVKDETRFFDWLDARTAEDPGRWAWLGEYASTNLVGRKPFSARIYRNSFEHEDCMDAGLYDGFVKKLRDVARLSETAGDSGLRSFAIQALSELGADLEPSVEDTNAIEYLQPSSPHPATNAPASHAETADGAKEPAP